MGNPTPSQQVVQKFAKLAMIPEGEAIRFILHGLSTVSDEQLAKLVERTRANPLIAWRFLAPGKSMVIDVGDYDIRRLRTDVSKHAAATMGAYSVNRTRDGRARVTRHADPRPGDVRKRGRRLRYPFVNMDVGQVYTLPSTDPGDIRAASSSCRVAAHRKGWKFERTIDAHGHLVVMRIA